MLSSPIYSACHAGLIACCNGISQWQPVSADSPGGAVIYAGATLRTNSGGPSLTLSRTLEQRLLLSSCYS